MAETLYVDRLGHRGDGIATAADGPVYVPFALPGETVEVERTGERARLLRVADASPARAAPVCGHFGECGGCGLQHMHGSGYLGWKRERVIHALRQRGIEAPVDAVAPVLPASRRRAVLAARFDGDGVLFGYHARQSDEVVPVGECPVLLPEIERALPELARWLRPLVPLAGGMRVAVTATRNGLDVALEGPSPRPPGLMAVVAAGARRLDVARLSIAGEVVLQNAEPVVDVDGVGVTPPPLAFLQAVELAESILARHVLAGIGKAKRVADLYAGIGTFALRIARRARVLAVEGDAPTLDALGRAARGASGLKPVETLRRDLERVPMAASELSRFDAVVFDPPRAGAKRQAAEIARSGVSRVVAVSCNPATLARDLRTLADGGYAVTKVLPVDQFLYSPHIEAVALLERAGGRR